MTDAPKSQAKFICSRCHAEIEFDDLWKPPTTPLDITYLERERRCPECGELLFRLPPKGDEPTD